MNIAEKYFKNQFSSDKFKRSFLEEKVKLNIEYKLEEFKKDIQTRKSPDELIKNVQIANLNPRSERLFSLTDKGFSWLVQSCRWNQKV